MQKILNKPFFIKLFHWEYWPFNVVYLPIFVYWFWLCLKSRSFFFFNNANPSIKNGGFLMESKKEIYDILPDGTYPTTFFFKAKSTIEEVLKIIENNIDYPFIAKPDIGMQGKAVKKILNKTDLEAYANTATFDFLVQTFVPYEKEVGIFYCRYPNATKGFISGIVLKEFLSITGNGVHTIEELVMQEQRFILQLPALKKAYGNGLSKILPNNENLVLVPYGNHARGSKFIDASHLIDDELTNSIDKLCKQINGFYFGRLDVRFESWSKLRKGENLSIIELNGAGSEPTHIYDPNHSIFFAWKEIIRHLNILYTISKQNYKSINTPYMKFKDGIQMLKQNKLYVKELSKF